jgi:dTDP-4-dehydrorhamnose 3,5-epimerase
LKIKETPLKDCFIVEPNVFKDERGSFAETFNLKAFRELTGVQRPFLQDNQSLSGFGVLRGLHYQKGDMAQAKLVRVARGRVIDVAVDLRKDSPTFGEHYSVELSGDNFRQLYVPRGFAHGFVVLEDHTLFSYKCDNYYDRSSEGGIIYNDATLSIDWHLASKDLIISQKDQKLPSFKEAVS